MDGEKKIIGGTNNNDSMERPPEQTPPQTEKPVPESAPSFDQNKPLSARTLVELGYPSEEIDAILKNCVISALKDGTLATRIRENYVSLTEDLGYTQDEVIKMTKQFPVIYGYSIDNMKQKILDMQELGYSQDDVIKMTKSSPAIYGLSIDNMKQKILDMQGLGYSQDDVIKMTKSLPTIYGLSINNMKQKILDMQELDYSQDDVIKMTKSLPTIYGLSINNMKQKIDFYDSIGMHDLIIADTKLLMQGVALSYARYQFFIHEQDIAIDTSNYKMLFMPQKQFKNKYGYNNAEIKQKYPYKEDEK